MRMAVDHPCDDAPDRLRRVKETGGTTAGIETDDEGIEAGFLFYDPDDSSRCYEVLFGSTDRGRILRSVSIGRCVVHAEEKDGRYVPQYYVYVPESSSRTGKISTDILKMRIS